MSGPSFNPNSFPSYNPSSYSPPPHFNPSNFTVPNFNHSLSPTPPLPTSYRDPIPPAYTASLVGRITPIPPPPTPSFQHSFTPPPSSFSPAPVVSRPPILPAPIVNPPSSFFSTHASHVRTERLTTPNIPPSLPSSWAAPLSQPPSLSPSLQLPSPPSFNPAPSLPSTPNLANPYLISNRPVGSSTMPQPLDPASLRFPGSNPFMSLPPPTFAAPSLMLPSLPLPAQWISSLPSFQATLPSRRQAPWTPPSIERMPIPSETALVRLPRSFSFTWQPQANFTFKADVKVQEAYRRQFEQNLKMFYQLDAPPERPFSQLPAMQATQLVFQIDRHTTVFVNPATLTDFFQKASPAQKGALQAQLVNLMERTAQLESRESGQVIKSSANLGQELAADALHSVAKVGGLTIEGFLGLAECFSRAYTPGRSRTGIAHLWRNEAVPAIHQKIDELCSTNRIDEFDSRKDPWYEQLVHSILANPLNALNLEQAAVKGTQVARQLLRLEFALEGASAPRVGKTFTEGLTGQQIASMEAISATPMSKIGQEANIAEEVRIATSQTVVVESKNPGVTGGFAGKKGFQLTNAEYQKVRNADAIINGREYVGHALDQMQNRGLPLSIVEETIRVGKTIIETQPQGRIQYFNPEQNISVVIEKETQKVITVFYGK